MNTKDNLKGRRSPASKPRPNLSTIKLRQDDQHEIYPKRKCEAWTVRRKTFAWSAGLVQYSVDDSLPELKELILANARTVFLHGLSISGNKLRTWS